MYYFIYTGDVIPEHLMNKLITELFLEATKVGHTYTYTEDKNSIAISSVFISIRTNQIFVSSPYDYCDGCVITDTVIHYILRNLGSLYTVIEP
ncbi:hypothetical protein [Alkalihalobacillus sp. R86527]|uniref:hypothetical protein n=1 Tax=Alkalihalobacillus sp. R86527 TaxID=3093863 RepID=UPI00366F2FE9